jgi:hypothetical protein
MSRSQAVPGAVQLSAVLWCMSLGVGVLETVVGITKSLTVGPSPGTGALFSEAVFRLVVTAVFSLGIAKLWAGRNWARIGLALLLGGLGTLSLTISPATALARGETLRQVLRAVDFGDSSYLVFGAVRVLHIALVLAAVGAMFLPRANAYFRLAPARRALHAPAA